MNRTIRPYGNYEVNHRGMENFYHMIDSFFNDEFTPQKAMRTSSFRVDLSEKEKSYLVEAELPGFTKEEIDIHFDDGKLTISAEKEEKKEENDEEKNYLHRERKFTQMSRTMYFKDVDESQIKASLEGGVLTVEVPKKEVVETSKKIEIQ